MTIDATRFALGLRRLFGRRAAAEELVEEGVVIGCGEDGRAVVLPAMDRSRSSNLLVLGATGTRKTTLVASATVEEIAADEHRPAERRNGYAVVDPKNDCADIIAAGISTRCPSRITDLVWLDAFGAGFEFNLCRLKTDMPKDILATLVAGHLARVSTAAGEVKHLGTGARQLESWTGVYEAVFTVREQYADAVDPLWGMEAFQLKDGFRRLAALVPADSRARMFLENAQVSDDLRASCASRARTAFAPTEQVSRLFTAGGCIDLKEVLGAGKVLCLPLGNAPLPSSMEFVGNQFGRLIIEELLRRPSEPASSENHLVRVILDEVHTLAPSLHDIAELALTTIRSRGGAITAISQGTTLIHEASPALLKVLLTNSAKLVGRLAASDAELFVKEVAQPLGVDEPLAAIRSRAAATICNLPDGTFLSLRPGSARRFTTRPVDLKDWFEAAEQRQAELDEAKRRYALPATPRRRVSLADIPLPPEAVGRSRKGKRRRTTAASPEPAGTPSTDNPPPKPRSRWG